MYDVYRKLIEGGGGLPVLLFKGGWLLFLLRCGGRLRSGFFRGKSFCLRLCLTGKDDHRQTRLIEHRGLGTLLGEQLVFRA